VNPPANLAEHPEVLDAFVQAATAMLRELTGYESWLERTGPADTVALAEAGPRIAARLRLLRHEPGELLLEMAEPSAEKLAARFLPPDTPLVSDLLDDAVGEFANVIAGQAKTVLKGTPFHFSLSTPTVARHLEQRTASEPIVAGTRPASDSQPGMVGMLIGFEEGQLRLLLSLSAEPGS
jgi:chemotaxis protein CheX